MSAQFTLLGQQGSEVIRGNLLFLPVGDSYLYVEPIFLQAESLNFPLLRGVVVVNGSTIALEETLDRAADVVLGLRSPAGSPGWEDRCQLTCSLGMRRRRNRKRRPRTLNRHPQTMSCPRIRS